MSHTGVDVIDFILITIYPVVALFIIEMASRALKISSWKKLVAQGITMTGFGLTYVIYLQIIWNAPHGFTSLVLIALAIALFYQAKRAKSNPKKTIY